MALIKEKKLSSGVIINYWKVMSTDIDWHRKRCVVIVVGFLSGVERDAGSTHLDSCKFSWEGVDFPLSETGANTVTQIYEKIKESVMVAVDDMSPDLVESNFFVDAADDVL